MRRPSLNQATHTWLSSSTPRNSLLPMNLKVGFLLDWCQIPSSIASGHFKSFSDWSRSSFKWNILSIRPHVFTPNNMISSLSFNIYYSIHHDRIEKKRSQWFNNNDWARVKSWEEKENEAAAFPLFARVWISRNGIITRILKAFQQKWEIKTRWCHATNSLRLGNDAGWKGGENTINNSRNRREREKT